MTPDECERIIHAGVPLAGEWGVRVLQAGGGTARLLLPRAERLLRPGRTVSGPALMGLADVAMWAALLGISEGRDESLTATMTIAFLRPCGEGPVLAEARLLKGTGRSLYGEVTIAREDDPATPCVHVTAGWVKPAPRGVTAAR